MHGLARYLILGIAVLLATACTHPVGIEGQGDVISSSGERDCNMESQPCEFQISGTYLETYTAVPRSGFRFSHWVNCLDTDGNRCSWNVDSETVKQNWFQTAPTLTASFAPNSNGNSGPNLDLAFRSPPFGLGGISAQFSQNIQYGEHERNRFDIFLPQSTQPTALIIYIHGGGFVSGDKTIPFRERTDEIKRYLGEGIAYASINYRYLTRNPDGLLRSLNDAKRALQFIRYHSNSFNVDKERVVIYGNSAGAGASLWLATLDDGADPQNSDPVLRESTRVRGAAVLEGQASYDFLKWETEVFDSMGISVLDIAANDSGLARRIEEGLNLSSIEQIYTSSAVDLRRKLDMLAQMGRDDPELYIVNRAQPATFPQNQAQLVHHPLHAQRLAERVEETGMRATVSAPPLNLNPNPAENHTDFLLRKTR